MINCFGRVFFIYLTLVKKCDELSFLPVVCQHYSSFSNAKRYLRMSTLFESLKKHIVWKSISLFIIWQNRYLRSLSRDICFFSGNCWYVKQCTFCLLQLNPTHIAYLLFPTFLHSACLNYIFPILPSLL